MMFLTPLQIMHTNRNESSVHQSSEQPLAALCEHKYWGACYSNPFCVGSTGHYTGLPTDHLFQEQ